MERNGVRKITLVLPEAPLDSPTHHRNPTSLSGSGLLFLQNRTLCCLCFAGLWMLVSVTMKLHVISSDYPKIARICKNIFEFIHPKSKSSL